MPRRLLICCLALFLAPIQAGAAELRQRVTEHYRIHTDLDEPFAQDLARRLEAMYQEYARRLVDFHPANASGLLDVYLFARQADYLTFSGETLANTGGVFIPHRNALAAFLEGQGRDGLRRTLQHEAFHQFAHHAIRPDLPVWLDEGMAQLFEEGIWSGEHFWLSQVPPWRLRQLQADMKHRRLTDFRTLMALTPEQWAKRLAQDPDAGATQYNQAWAMVHFLVNARDEAGRERYRARLVHMLKLLHQGQRAQDAFATAFSDNIDGFQDRFVDFARKLQETPQAAYLEHQEILADMLRAFRERGRVFSDMRGFRDTAIDARCQLQYNRGPVQWTTDPDPNVYFSDLSGQRFTAEQMFFQPRPGTALPDLVVRCAPGIQLRSRFHQSDGKIDHEVLIETSP